MAYSLMVLTYEEATGQADYAEYNLPKLQFKSNRIFKSSAWLVLAGISVLSALLTQAQTASAAYVSTNGSCLHIRSGPSTAYRIVECIPNGTVLPAITETQNGFARLSSGRYVSRRWISDTYNPRPTNPGGVGGPITLRIGSRGAAVSQVQRALGVQPTGYYGSVTASRVREFQARNNLLVDGVVGPQTRSVLLANSDSSSRPGVGGSITLRIGSRGEAVSQVQTALGIQATGYYDSFTASRVREFQARNNLLADGIVGPQTRNTLFAES
ncbi:peptidoglycan-binding protein [Nostoc minutum NIES-26]|uniref:Peptidoglycan-binding protein n=1 Tax=Nostoc minutum NIES-26 TaxID=1844469 RepID=A0A367QCW4_9NOSO|nr:peptidoglycan-binding protein [Nostoc minutum NIES-26]